MTRWNRQNLDSTFTNLVRSFFIFFMRQLIAFPFILDPERMAMLKELCEMSIRGEMRSPECKIFIFVDYKNALNNSLSSFTKKSLFVVDS